MGGRVTLQFSTVTYPSPSHLPRVDFLIVSVLACSLAQKLVPSAGCGSFLLAGAAMYRRISISTVSMVKSRFQDAMLGSLERSTCVGIIMLAQKFRGRSPVCNFFCWIDRPYRSILREVCLSVPSAFQDSLTLPLLALTQGRLTLLMKVTSGGESGYEGPQWILSE